MEAGDTIKLGRARTFVMDSTVTVRDTFVLVESNGELWPGDEHGRVYYVPDWREDVLQWEHEDRTEQDGEGSPR